MKTTLALVVGFALSTNALGQTAEDCQNLRKIIRPEKIAKDWPGRSPEWVRSMTHMMVDNLGAKADAAKIAAEIKAKNNKKFNAYEYKYKNPENQIHKFIEEERELPQLLDLGNYLFSALQQKAPADKVENFVYMKGHDFKWSIAYDTCQKGDPTVKWDLLKK